MLSYFECISIISCNLSYNLKMHYFTDNYVFLRIYFRVDYSHLSISIIELVSGEALFSSDFTPLYTYISMSNFPDLYDICMIFVASELHLLRIGRTVDPERRR